MCSFRTLTFLCFFTLLHSIEMFDADAKSQDPNSYNYEPEIRKKELVHENSMNLTVNKSFSWSEYLEENEHFLFGSDTPIFMAKRNLSTHNWKNPSYFSYRRIPYIISGAQEIERIIAKRHSTNKNSSKIKAKNVESQHSTTLDYFREIDSIYDFSDTSLLENHNEYSHSINIGDNYSAQTNENRKISKNRVTDIIYLRILVVVDYHTYSFHDKDEVLIATYISSIINGVDLRFRQMSNPKIRLNIAGLIIPEEPQGTQYLNHFIIEHDDYVNFKDAGVILSETKNYFNEIFPKSLCEYDMVLAIVNLPLKHGNQEIKGRVEKTLNWEKILPIALITDNGHSNDILPITRALGHLLGAPFDGERTKNISGGPCLESDGYIMSIQIKNGLFWSKCSIKGMQDYLNDVYPKDRFNKKPKIGTPMKKKLPGKLYNRNEQCKGVSRYSKSDVNKQSNCLKLECEQCSFFHEYLDKVLSSNYFCESTTTNFKIIPAEGSSCGSDKICLNGECINNSVLETETKDDPEEI